MVRVLSLATARPEFLLTQNSAKQFILKNIQMRPGTHALYEKILSDGSIKNRRFALKDLNEVLIEDPDHINRRFERESVSLSAKTLTRALKKAKIHPRSLDFLAVSTCTGYLCPGISSRLIEECGLREDVHCLDIVGMGCGSAIPALESANNFIQANPEGTAATVSTEICSAATFWDDSADLVVSNSIFADGSAAAVLSNSKSRGLASILKFDSATYPKWRDTLRFKMENGRLRNVLGKAVPEQVAQALGPLIEKTFKGAGIHRDQVRHWMFHSGGKRVLDGIQKALGFPTHK